MITKTVKELKQGEFFTLKDYGEYPPESRVYVRGYYERSSKKYECKKFYDWNAESFLKGSRVVYTGFTF